MDVLVVGGSCCGCAAALTLARHTSRSVLVLAGSSDDAPRPGETVSAAFAPLLAFLGVADLLADPCIALPDYSHAAAWGGPEVVTRESLFSADGAGSFLDRQRLDRALAGGCEAAGARWWKEAWLRRIERIDGGWRVSVSRGRQTKILQAQQVIDATGRRAAFARRAGAAPKRTDRLVAVVQRLTPDADRPLSSETLVESVPEGWWYSAPLPNGQAVVAWMTDSDLLLRSRAATPEIFDHRLGQAPATRQRVKGWHCDAAPRVTPASTQYLELPLGDHWVAAGDAALALDPLSSVGLGRAVSSGIQAARIVAERLRGGTTLSSAYAAQTHAQFEQFRRQHRSVYCAETRWRTAPFWQRRTNPASDPEWAVAT